MSDLRSSELSQRRAEEERADRERQEAVKQLHETKIENNKREDELVKSHQKEYYEAMQRSDEALRNQKDADNKEMMTREKIDQEMRKQTEQNKNRIEESIFSNVKARKEENTRFQEECHNEKKQFGLKVLKTAEENNAIVLNETQRTNEIKLGNEKNQIDHDSRVYELEERSMATKMCVNQEREKDRKEAVFIAVVKRMISAGRDVTGKVDSLADHTFKLTTGSGGSDLEGDIELCETCTIDWRRSHMQVRWAPSDGSLHIISMINDKIVKLQESCLDISNSNNTDHSMVEQVQKKAEEIKESAREIQKHLAQFQALLSNDSNTESLNLFQNVQAESESLKKMIKLIPAVTQTNHAETYLRKQRETLALGTGKDHSSVAAKGKVQASLKDKK